MGIIKKCIVMRVYSKFSPEGRMRFVPGTIVGQRITIVYLGATLSKANTDRFDHVGAVDPHGGGGLAEPETAHELF